MRTIHTRTEFLTSTTAQAFADAIAHPSVIAGVRAALLEFMVSEPRGHAWEDAARSHHYTQGARDFAEYLLTFIDPEPAKPQPTTENLKWPTRQSLQQRQPKPAGK